VIKLAKGRPVSHCLCIRKVAKEKTAKKTVVKIRCFSFHFTSFFPHCHNTRGKRCTHTSDQLITILLGLLSVFVDIIKFQGSLFKRSFIKSLLLRNLMCT